MPRIEPLELLTCLSVLLSPEGGVASQDAVPRLVSLMTKFSKKLVSKCVYILILKHTEVHVLDMFMEVGGWSLMHTLLLEAMSVANWDLVTEILELLLMTPVDSPRLRLNNIPKLVKSLSKREDLEGVQKIATTLVENWLVIVKNSTTSGSVQEAEKEKCPPADLIGDSRVEIIETDSIEEVEKPTEENEVDMVEEKEGKENGDAISASTFYKVTVRDGKQVISKLGSLDGDAGHIIEEVETETKDESKKDEKREKSRSKSSSHTKKSSSSSKEKHRSSSSKSSSKSSSRSDSGSSSSSRDKDRDRKDRDRDKSRHRKNGSAKSSSNSSSRSSSSSKESDKKESKEKQAEKDKDTLAKLKPHSIDKIGRIPKKTDSSEKDKKTTDADNAKEIKKKPTMSIEVRKSEVRPKTVKVYNSKMRSTGLEEEVKPPPSRSAIKKAPPPVVIPPPKRPSPPKDTHTAPVEKKLKLEIPDKPGAVKLIPPKPKPVFLQESDIFMDALTASANKKEPKKRKRRISASKESPESSPAVQQSPSATSPIGLKSFSPANFYQDTLDTENQESQNKETEEGTKNDDRDVEENRASTPTDTTAEDTGVSEPKRTRSDEPLKSVLVHVKKKGPKRSIQWKNDETLVEIRYFELDETERVNVSRPNFNDMAKMEMCNEREALMHRKLPNEDMMEPIAIWRFPYLVDQPELPVQPGCKSLEKDIQYAREKNILQALYFNKKLIPDSPAEPIPEIHQMSDPVPIPLEDPESQEYDLRSTPWPEPKGSPPPEPIPNIPPLFQAPPNAFPNPNFPPQIAPQGFHQGLMPNFGPPNIMPNGPNMIPNHNMMGGPMGPPPDMLNQGPPINPNIFGPPGPGPDAFNPMMGDGPNFPPPFSQPNMNMFHGPPGNFNMNRGGNRGGFRRGGNAAGGNWVRMNGPVPNQGNWGNRGGRGGRLCKNVKNHGYCRNRDSCPFVHPN